MTTADDPLSRAFSARLAALRKERGWSVQALSDASDMSHRAVVYLEAGGASPTLRTMAALAHGLDLSLSALVEGLPATGGHGPRV